MARIGIFGGSFNPPHLGHILAVEEFRTQLRLDRVIMIPAGDPPHKDLSSNSPTAWQRYEMTCLAAKELPCTEVSQIEISRPGRSYTADTLALLRKEFPEDEFFLLMGTDMFYSFASWYRPDAIVKEPVFEPVVGCAICRAFDEGRDPEKFKDKIISEFADFLYKKQ